MKNLLLKGLDYLRYPSTWKGIVTAATSFGVSLNPELSQQIITAGVAIFSAISILFSDADVKAK